MSNCAINFQFRSTVYCFIIIMFNAPAVYILNKLLCADLITLQYIKIKKLKSTGIFN